MFPGEYKPLFRNHLYIHLPIDIGVGGESVSHLEVGTVEEPEPEATQLPGNLPALQGIFQCWEVLSFPFLSVLLCTRDSGVRAINPLIAKQGHLGQQELRRGVIT